MRANLKSLFHSCSFGANEMSRITNSDVVSSATSLFSAPFSPLATGEAAQCRLQGGPRSEGNRWVGRSSSLRSCHAIAFPLKVALFSNVSSSVPIAID